MAELRAAFARFTAGAVAAVLPAAGTLDEFAAGRRHSDFDLASPGPPICSAVARPTHNLLNARAALAAVELAGLRRRRGGRRSHRLPRRAPPARVEGRAGATHAIYDDYAHHPTEVRAALDGAARAGPERLIAAFQPHLYSRTKAFAEQFGAALALADEVAVLDVYPAREEPVGELAGVSGLDVARAAADRMGGRPVLWTPTLAAGRGGARPPARARRRRGHDRRRRRLRGRRGADRRTGASDERAAAGVDRDFPLARLTTVRTGGAADWFARPRRPGTSSARCSPGPRRRGCRSAWSARARTCWSPTTGFRGLALKLVGDAGDGRARR